MVKKSPLFFLSLFLFLGFVYFSYLVHKGYFTQLDFDTTVRFQNHLVNKWDLPFSIITLVGSAEVTGAVVLVFFVYFLIKKKPLVSLAMLLFLFTLPIELYGKIFVYHPGPPYMFYKGALNFSFPSSYVHSSYSYPSGHATRLTFIISFLILLLYFRFPLGQRWAFQLLLVCALATVYISRIYLGEHWLTDVVGGALLGGSLGILAGTTIPARKKII